MNKMCLSIYMERHVKGDTLAQKSFHINVISCAADLRHIQPVSAVAYDVVDLR
jgi:hypothetical protein